MKTSILSILAGFLIFACSDDPDSLFCFSFDERQCATDLWKDSTDFSLSEAQKISKLTDALDDLDLEVEEIILDPNFHDAVCEACHVCPTGTRFFVRLSEDPGSTLESLDLLNYQLEECDRVF